MQDTFFIGWDIGGAHLKVASIDASGKPVYIEQFPTPLWQGLQTLEQVFPVALNALPEGRHYHAVTMTGELSDIFTDREEGLTKLSNLCKRYLGESVSMYAGEQGLVKNNDSSISSMKMASANWHASSDFVATSIDSGIFIDVGSTTTDIIPFKDKQVLVHGYDDQTRMQNDEMVYTGIIRTPLMALCRRVPFAGKWQTTAAEHFATTADIYRILGLLNEETDQMPAADGGNKDMQSSIRRVARMLGVDASRFPDSENWLQLAGFYRDVQLQHISDALQRVVSDKTGLEKKLIAAGAGRFLIKALAERLNYDFIEFSDLSACEDKVADKCNTCAPAVALAALNRRGLNS